MINHWQENLNFAHENIELVRTQEKRISDLQQELNQIKGAWSMLDELCKPSLDEHKPVLPDPVHDSWPYNL